MEKTFANISCASLKYRNTEKKRHFFSRTEHLNTSGIISHGTDSFRVKPRQTPGYDTPKISTRLTIFQGSI